MSLLDPQLFLGATGLSLARIPYSAYRITDSWGTRQFAFSLLTHGLDQYLPLCLPSQTRPQEVFHPGAPTHGRQHSKIGVDHSVALHYPVSLSICLCISLARLSISKGRGHLCPLVGAGTCLSHNLLTTLVPEFPLTAHPWLPQWDGSVLFRASSPCLTHPPAQRFAFGTAGHMYTCMGTMLIDTAPELSIGNAFYTLKAAINFIYDTADMSELAPKSATKHVTTGEPVT